jgi:hypothetical protein
MVTRHAHAYIPLHEQPIIFAAVAVNDAGIRYEAGSTAVVPLSAPVAEIGSAATKVLTQYTRKDRNLRDIKKTDWPAYRASGLKALKHFEKEFSFVAIEHSQSSLTLTRFEQSHSAVDTVHLASQPSEEEIGRAFLQLRARLHEEI